MGDGRLGHPPTAPYEAINVAASGDVPVALEEQLARGGRLVAPVVQDGQQRLSLLRRAESGLARTAYEPVRFVPLV